jgi:hypothetical protein
MIVVMCVHMAHCSIQMDALVAKGMDPELKSY